jgi:hypothetical protein
VHLGLVQARARELARQRARGGLLAEEHSAPHRHERVEKGEGDGEANHDVEEDVRPGEHLEDSANFDLLPSVVPCEAVCDRKSCG